MLSKEQLLRIDPSLSTLSEDELQRFRDSMYVMAEIAFDVWYANKKSSKNPVRSLTTDGTGCKI